LWQLLRGQVWLSHLLLQEGLAQEMEGADLEWLGVGDTDIHALTR
jgi:hypothetical protein